ncbi:hypothetical protein ABEF95_013018 [Exophiala dermatitidis]
MSVSRNAGRLRPQVTKRYNPLFQAVVRRQNSSANRLSLRPAHDAPSKDGSALTSTTSFPLSRLPTFSLIRSLALGLFMSSTSITRPGLAALRMIANSKSALLDPDKNILIRSIVKPFIYDHFCAGTDEQEVRQKVASIKSLGFAGVILCYGREVQAGKEKNVLGPASEATPEQQIVEWRDGTLRTLSMIESSDFLGIKLTGAGTGVMQCLLEGSDPPALFSEAMDAICRQAASQGSRIWIDSEQQAVQSTIDKWTIDLMRRYNTSGKALVYNTLQAYLKASRGKLGHQLRLSQQEGWTLAIKLVRGAYMAIEERSLIRDTKADTDESYNGIVRDLLLGTVDGIPQDKFPPVKLFLATHNTETVRQAVNLASRLSKTGQLKVAPEFGQLQGMADDIGFEIIHSADAAKSTTEANTDGSSGVHGAFVPLVYKCLTWGSLRECMRYLVRRAEENMGATGRLKEGLLPITAELWHRSTRSLRRQDNGS